MAPRASSDGQRVESTTPPSSRASTSECVQIHGVLLKRLSISISGGQDWARQRTVAVNPIEICMIGPKTGMDEMMREKVGPLS